MIEVGHTNPSHHKNMTENAAKSRHPLRKRGIQYAAASRFHNACSGILDRPPSRAMTAESAARSYDHDGFNFQRAPPSLRATGSRECAPDDRLREAIHLGRVKKEWIASL